MADANIMIVEDECILAEDLKEVLLDLEYNVVGCVASGEAAIDMAASNKVDLVLMDIKIDGHMDGIDTARVIGERYRIPVIYLTAFCDDITLNRAKRTEPLGYIIKPYRASEIKSVIEIALFKMKIEKYRRHAHHELNRRAQKHADRIEEMNTALKILMEYRDNEKNDIIRSLAKDLKDRVIPHFDTIKMRWPNEDLDNLLDSITTTLQDITRHASSDTVKAINLTPTESRVADLIRQGRTSKEIANLLGITVRGVTFHRANIRRKLGLQRGKGNLKTTLIETI